MQTQHLIPFRVLFFFFNFPRALLPVCSITTWILLPLFFPVSLSHKNYFLNLTCTYNTHFIGNYLCLRDIIWGIAVSRKCWLRPICSLCYIMSSWGLCFSFLWPEIWYHVKSSHHNPFASWHMAQSGGRKIAALTMPQARTPARLCWKQIAGGHIFFSF